MIRPTIENIEYNVEELFLTLKELSVKNKTISTEEKELSKDIFIKQILFVLESTYKALNYLDEKCIINGQVIKFENNPNSINTYINSYRDLLNNAIEQEDDNLIWRYNFSIAMYEEVKRDIGQALQKIRIMLIANLMLEDKEYYNLYMPFLQKNDNNNYENTLRNYHNKDLFISLYNQLEGYKVSHKQILKSAGLKIFNYFELITKVQKKALADKIEHIFASLGEDISIDPKRASYIQNIGEFNNIILLDYASNKKNILNDFGLYEIFTTQINLFVKQLKKSRNKEMITRINHNKKHLEIQLIQQLLK